MMHIKQVIGGAHLHVRACIRADMPLFRISETAGPIALKFGEWLETHFLSVLQKSKGWAHLHVRACARADVPPFPYLRNGWTN